MAENEKKQQSEAVPETAEAGKSPPVDKVVVARDGFNSRVSQDFKFQSAFGVGFQSSYTICN